MNSRGAIGIPRALLYHKYGRFWCEFFRQLGCKTVISIPTNKDILSRGVAHSIDETCLSVKIYLGHVDWLIGKCDLIFIPRYAALRSGEELCTKFRGMYDIVNNTFENAPLLTCNITHERNEMWEFIKIGMRLHKTAPRALLAYLRAKRVAKTPVAAAPKNDTDLRILIVAHPYTTYDYFLGHPIVKFLQDNRVGVIYADTVDGQSARDKAGAVSAGLYWSYHKELLGAIEQYKDKVNGLLFLSTFPCGPDSLFVDFCIHYYKDLPAVVIMLDEQTGDAGIRTRLESFIDILRMRKETLCEK
jgi:predicted nucleotide-binding protein (sugar kinase/HSP70/actin superfamily)